ncbi:MAG: alpha/beta hydrolase [Bacteriovorax sp.]|nr:alpha/beta hydrolase [Bacteriovorax sp.]
MQINKTQDHKLIWQNLEDKISITQFPSSMKPSSNVNSTAKVYVKSYEALTADASKKIKVFLLHDIGQHHGRFSNFIDWTRHNNPGVSFVAMDFSGHGLSSGTRGHFDKFDYLVNDFLYLVTQMKKSNEQNEKWIVVGHGLGGLVVLDLLNRFQSQVEKLIDGLILSNFILKFKSPVLKLEQQMIGALNGISEFFAHSRPYRLLRGPELLSCPDAILSYEQDPLLIHRPTLKSLSEIQNKIINIYQDSYFLDIPIMLLESGKGDQPEAQGISYFARGIKKDLLTEKKYSLMKHDLYNELDREIIFCEIMNWMKMYEN